MASYDEESLKNLFDSMDHDNSGSLDKNEVKECLRRAGKFSGEAQLEALFQACDKNLDGMLSFDEFQMLMTIPDKENPLALATAVFAEFLGTMLFQFFGGLGTDYGAYMNGIILVVLIYCTAGISGGNLNPAVSFALACARQISPVKAILYIVAQIVGAICGAAMYKGLDADAMSCTLPSGGKGTHPKLNAGHIFGFEFLATFVLVFTVFGAAVDPKSAAANLAPVAIGFSLWGCASGIAEFTGAGLNPARTLGPAVVFNCWSDKGGFSDTFQWAYVLAQLSAGGIVALVYMGVFFSRPEPPSDASANVFKFMALETGQLMKRLNKPMPGEKLD